MPDDTTTALQALITQVETLTTTVTDQQKRMEDLHTQNGRLLDQVKDAKREKQPTPSFLEKHLDREREKRDLDSKNLERGPNGNLRLQNTGPVPHTLTRAEARDPKQYHAAKAAAAAAGVELRVLRDGEDPTNRHTGQSDIVSSKVYTFDDNHERIRWVRADMQTGKGIVQRRMQAEHDGYTVKTFRTSDDLPGHAKIKFELMERAANADSDS